MMNEFGRQILSERYYAPGEKEPEDLFRRVAKVCSIPDVIHYSCISKSEECKEFGQYSDLALRVMKRENMLHDSIRDTNLTVEEINEIWQKASLKYFTAMKDLDFMPASPTLLNAGRLGTLSSCFFMRIEDSLDSILDTIKKNATVMKFGGGVGLDFSEIRPDGSPISKTNGKASGPVSYMKIFNSIGDQINQAGIRKSAMLACLRVDHPDIMKFIRCKETEGDLANFNVSILVDDKFMKAVENDDLISLNHSAAKKNKTIKAREIWDTVIDCAHKNGEPGVIFQDRVDTGDVFKGKYGKLGPNPCGELLLHNYSSCNLAAINLNNCYDESSNSVDYMKLKYLVEIGINFLDNVISLNNYFLPEIEEATLRGRPIGLGTMGLHDLMLRCKIAYGSDRSLSLINGIYGRIRDWAIAKSERLGEVRGIPDSLKEVGINRRNSNLMTVQPTGTVSLICGVSNGIEPIFQWKYKRKDTYGEHEMKHPILDVYEKLPDFAKTALEISPEDHVQVQAKVQEYIDASVSKTINMPNDATITDIDKAMKLAYDLKCKSITVYRSGSRKKEVLIRKQSEQERPKDKIRHRPRILPGVTFRQNTPGGKAYVTINEDKEGIREVFIHISKAGSEIGSHVESEGRLISYALKHRNPVGGLINHLEGQKSSPIWEHGRSVKSVPDAVAKLMKEYIEHWEGFSEGIEDYLDAYIERNESNKETLSGGICLDCGESMYIEGNCEVCRNCGYSSCG